MQRKRQGSKSLLSFTHRGMTTLPTHAFRLHCPHGYRRPPLVALAHGAARGRHDVDPARARHAARVVARAKPSALEVRDRSRGRAAAGVTAGGTLTFSFAGLVIGSVFYSLPFVVQPLQNAFAAVSHEILEAAATLRASPLDRIVSEVLPQARRGFDPAAVLGI